ncbi:hypothetical protein [Rhizobium halophytocola]|uniref:Uncharacterized protein n=1 Tax=Rhizobium halophytocola TaxID=735519 RepID=A0ABS4DYP8_9HYPH|nr:hypothetical protein [Rhizobium halophytocola]MBP1850812.1 hypothetical protein [Rhizobium halophytocola]
MTTQGKAQVASETTARAAGKPNLVALYHPVGLKAVAAAAMMLKRKPKAA